MTYDDLLKVREMLKELKGRYVPDEERDRNHRGQLGFDYGYQHALAMVDVRLYQLMDVPEPERIA